MALDLGGNPAGRLASRLAAQFGSWAPIAGDLDLPALDRAPAAGKWPARQHLAHVARMHEIYAGRIEAILSKDVPALAPYRAESDPEWPSWSALTARQIFERARPLRARLVDLVRPLSDLDLARVGEHGRLGPLPLSLWLEFFLAHESHHLYQVFRLVREP